MTTDDYAQLAALARAARRERGAESRAATKGAGTTTTATEFKTRYKFIHFERTPVTFGGHPMYECLNNQSGAELCVIVWYGRWRQYVMQADPEAAFSADCLADIQHFMGQLKERER